MLIVVSEVSLTVAGAGWNTYLSSSRCLRCVELRERSLGDEREGAVVY